MQRVKYIKISDDVKDTLRQSTITGDLLVLPGQLDRTLYVETNKVLLELGAKWNRSRKGHVFPGGDTTALKQALGEVLEQSKIINKKQTFQFFPTPDDLADTLVMMANVTSDDEVLEPSAGDGAIVRAITRRTVCKIRAIEIDPRHKAQLESTAVQVTFSDFLQTPPLPIFSRIVANPPFNAGQDIAHVRHMVAHLRPGGRLVAVMSPSAHDGRQRKQVEFREWLSQWPHEWHKVAAGTFKESGTNVSTFILVVNLPQTSDLAIAA